MIFGFSLSSPEVSGGASAASVSCGARLLLGGLLALDPALLLTAAGGGERDGGEAEGYEVAGAHGAEE